MKNPSLVGFKATLTSSGRTTISASRLIGILRFLLIDGKFIGVFPYFCTGGTFHDDKVGGDVSLGVSLFFYHNLVVTTSVDNFVILN